MSHRNLLLASFSFDHHPTACLPGMLCWFTDLDLLKPSFKALRLCREKGACMVKLRSCLAPCKRPNNCTCSVCFLIAACVCFPCVCITWFIRPRKVHCVSKGNVLSDLLKLQREKSVLRVLPGCIFPSSLQQSSIKLYWLFAKMLYNSGK